MNEERCADRMRQPAYYSCQTTIFGKIHGRKTYQQRNKDEIHITESFRAFCGIVSFTVAKTNQMLVVSVAFVRWGYTLNRARLACMKHHKMYFAALLMSGPAVYSGKYFLSGTFGSLLLKTSILLIIDVRRNQQELIMLSNSTRESAILVVLIPPVALDRTR